MASRRISALSKLKAKKNEASQTLSRQLLVSVIVEIQKIMFSGISDRLTWWPIRDILGLHLYEQAFQQWFGNRFYIHFKNDVLIDKDECPFKVRRYSLKNVIDGQKQNFYVEFALKERGIRLSRQ